MLPLGSGLGGTTLVNSGTCFRTPAARARALALRVSAWSSTQTTLDRCFRACRRCAVGERGDPRAGRGATPRWRGAAPSGWAGRTATCDATPAAASARACASSAAHLGQAAHRHHLRAARRAAGARIVTGADGGRDRRARRAGARRASTADRRDSYGGGGEIEVKRAMRRPRLRHDPHAAAAGRQRHRARASGQLGRNLSLHPATAAFALMDEVVDMARGVPQSFYVDEFADDGIMFEGVAGPPAYAAMSLPLHGRAPRRARCAPIAGWRSSA